MSDLSAADRRAQHESLDAWRGVAILLVFVFHAFLELNVSGPDEDADIGWVGRIASAPLGYFFPQHLGVFGVQLFFVISGFCIHRSTLDWDARTPTATAGQRWRAFATRRFWRIYPLYALVLGVLFVLKASPPRPDGVDRIGDLFVHAGMLHSLVPDHINLISPSLWSLAVEVQLYALYPLVWLAFRRFGPLRTVAVGAIFALGWELGVPQLTRSPWIVNLPWRWGFEWLLGAYVAATVGTGPRGKVVLLAAAVGAAVLMTTRSPILYATVAPLVFALVVAWAAQRRASSPPERALAALGRVSYPLYLVHGPVFSALGAALVARGVRTVDLGPFLVTTGVTFVVTTAGAWALEHLGRTVQRRGLRLGRLYRTGNR